MSTQSKKPVGMTLDELHLFFGHLQQNQIIRVVLLKDHPEAAGALAEMIVAGVFKPASGDPFETQRLFAIRRSGWWRLWESNVVELWVLVDFHGPGTTTVSAQLVGGVENVYIAETSPMATANALAN